MSCGSRNWCLFLQLCISFFCTLIICKWDCVSGPRGCFYMWKWGFLFGVTLSTWDWWQGSIYVPGQLAGVLNNNLYQPGEEGWTGNSLGCADIWWLFIYLCTIWDAFRSRMGQLSIYDLLAFVFWAVPLYFCGNSPTLFASWLEERFCKVSNKYFAYFGTQLLIITN